MFLASSGYSGSGRLPTATAAPSDVPVRSSAGLVPVAGSGACCDRKSIALIAMVFLSYFLHVL